MAAESSLIVRVGADISDLVSGFEKGSKEASSFTENMRSVGTTLVTVTAAAVAAGAAIVGALVNSGREAIDTQADLAKSLGGTYNSLTTLRLAGQDAGVSFETLTSASQRLTQKIGEALNGSKEASKGFNQLGIDAFDLANMDLDQRFEFIAQRIQQLGLGAEQTAGVLRTMGLRSTDLANILLDGGAAIRGAREDVDALGLSLSAIDVQKVQAANDSFDRFSSILQGVKQRFAVAFAPYLDELSRLLTQTARDSNAWGEQITGSIEGVVSAFSRVADVVRGLQVVFKGVQIAFWTFAQAFWDVVQLFVDGFALMGDVANSGANLIIKALNAIPGVDIAEYDMLSNSPFVQGVRNAAQEAENMRRTTIEGFKELVNAELPSDKVDAFFGAVRDRATEAAASTVAAQESLTVMGELADIADETDKERKVRRIEEEKIHKQVLEDIERQHLDNLDTIRYRSLSDQEQFLAMSYKDQVQTVSKNLANMTAAASRESKAMFELNKVAGISNAIVSTYTGMTKALEWGFPLGPIFAAVIGASGFAQIAAIKSQSFGGGGAAPSLAGGTAAPPVTPVNGGVPSGSGGGGGAGSQTLVLQGLDPDAIFSGRAVQSLAEKLVEFQRDGGQVVFG